MAGNTRRGIRLSGIRPAPGTSALRRSALGAALAAALALALVSSASLPRQAGLAADVAGAPAGTITETGSTLLLPLMTTWATAYHEQHPSVTVKPDPPGHGTGSSVGIADATNGSADIGATDAYLSSGDLVKNPTLVNIPLTVSAQAVVYNLPGISAHLNLNGTVLAEIYQGKITTWNDPQITRLNPNVPLTATKIVPFYRSDGSGDTFLFASYLSTQDAAWDSAIGYGTTVNWPVKGKTGKAAKGNGGMVAGCKATPGCLAYVGISYQRQAAAAPSPLGEAQLLNTAGQYELPTAQAVKAALGSFVSLTPPDETISLIGGPAVGGYPIINYEYAVVSTRQPSAAKASALAAFLDWAVTTGNTNANYLGQYGFQPLPPSLVALGEAQIKEIKGP